MSDAPSVEQLAKQVKEIQDKSETRFYITMGGVVVALFLIFVLYMKSLNSDAVLMKTIVEMQAEEKK